MDVLAIVLLVAFGFVAAGLRKRIGALETMVLRLQDRVTDLSSRSSVRASTCAPASASTAAPIDIEPFVD
jgi:hypothetical protein